MRIEIKDFFMFVGVAVALLCVLMFGFGWASGKLQGLETGLAYTGVIK